MGNIKTSSGIEDTLFFAEEKKIENPVKKNSPKKFKLLIVDDEKEVHVMTKLVLSDYCYEDATLDFFSAYSGQDALKLLSDHPDAALILLDVVMETKDAGLNVAKYIREDIKNNKIRIILRTGQPGKAPEKDIIVNYDINDYKEKTELTTQKLFTTITTALRAYIHLRELEIKNKEIATKNKRLNEEIARRVVAESNLTKYNRSLEKMIDSKSERLKKALQNLADKEEQLIEASRMAHVGQVSSSAIPQLAVAGKNLSTNLATLDKYRNRMTQLLDKYQVLQDIIASHSSGIVELNQKTDEMLENIDQIKDDIKLKEIMEKYPNIIKDSARGIAHIGDAVDDIRLFISICDEPMVSSDVVTLLEEVLNELRPDSSRISIQKDYGSLPLIMAAKSALKKALYEIIKNAVEAVTDKGIVSIDSQSDADCIRIRINDNGQGIAKANKSLVFKPYFSTKKDGAKGLGLPFAKSVLSKHRGHIEIVSNQNEGTTVTVKLNI